MAAPECLKPPFLGPTCPGLKPPPGVIPNLINPESQKNYNYLCQITCLVVCTISVAIRMYTRICITRSQGREDYACFVAWLGLLVYCALQLTPTFVDHAGVHQWNVMQKDLVPWVKLASNIEIIYNPIIFITKLSILLLFLRIFVPNGKGATYYMIHFVIWFNLLFYIANIPIEIWPCIPRRKLWEPQIPGTCLNNERVFIAGGTINVVSDFAILLLPLVSIAKLQMPMRRKIGVSTIFATGFFACIASIMHLATSVKAARNDDKTYYLFPVALWTTAEIALGILCGCLLTMPHFFRYFAPKIASKLYFSRASESSGRRSSTSANKNHHHPYRQQKHNKIISLLPVRRAKPVPQWHDLYDTNTTATTTTNNDKNTNTNTNTTTTSASNRAKTNNNNNGGAIATRRDSYEALNASNHSRNNNAALGRSIPFDAASSVADSRGGDSSDADVGASSEFSGGGGGGVAPLELEMGTGLGVGMGLGMGGDGKGTGGPAVRVERVPVEEDEGVYRLTG